MGLIPWIALAEKPEPLAALLETLASRGREIRTFHLEGTVCATAGQTLMALQDESATVLLETPAFAAGTRAGDRVRITGKNCAITRGRVGLQLGTAPVVEIDGRHPPVTKSGSVFLDAGLQPLRVEWFNGISHCDLLVEWEGPELQREKIPPSAMFRRIPDGGHQAGLDFQAYIGDDWSALPDFSKLTPVATGVADHLDISLRHRLENGGMVFTGFLNIPRPGTYAFQATSDDGSRIFVGDPAATCVVEKLDGEPAAPARMTLAQAITGRERDRWVTTEGEVTFAARQGRQLELELTENGMPLPVIVADGGESDLGPLLHQRVRVAGIYQPSRLIVASHEHIEVTGSSDSPRDDELLVTAETIRRLQPAEARKPLRALVRGVVTMCTPGSLVLQDATGGVFILHGAADWTDQPRPGEWWEIEGDTDPGDFSPMIKAERAVCRGSAALPEPVRPTWEQLMNGSLDAELVELQGVIMSASPAAIQLLTRDGKVKINYHEYYPLPSSAPDLAGSVVRLRGVFTANWDPATGRVKAGEFYLGNVLLSVEEPAPEDPFVTPSMRATDLLLFTSHAHALKRVKIAGQVLHALPHEAIVHDGTIGLRVLTREPLSLQPGDRVEAVGFPRLGKPSPVLLEAMMRKTGSEPLPPPEELSAGDLPDSRRDSKLVKIEAQLLSDTLRQDERVLEMQAGAQRFLARLHGGAPQKSMVRGSLLQLTGVYASAREDQGGREPFELLLGRPTDIVLLRQGPWWTVRHTIAVVTILSGGLLLALLWVKVLRKTVAQRTTQLASEIGERQRAEQHRVMEQERARVAQDLHDELGAGLTEAGILSSLVKNPAVPQEQKDGYLDQLSETCRTLVTGLDEIVWAVNPRYDSAADLAGYYSLFAQRFLALAGIACRLQVAESIPEHPLDSRLRHGVFLAFKEVLNNVVRHSQASEVKLAISVESGILNVSVTDNGRGFEVGGDLPGSDGLEGIKRRMRDLGGDCRIDSHPGRGCTVKLTLPLERKTT
jgi:signal transduction histidine kinase